MEEAGGGATEVPGSDTGMAGGRAAELLDGRIGREGGRAAEMTVLRADCPRAVCLERSFITDAI